jgi:hypothetical protein
MEDHLLLSDGAEELDATLDHQPDASGILSLAEKNLVVLIGSFSTLAKEGKAGLEEPGIEPVVEERAAGIWEVL